MGKVVHWELWKKLKFNYTTKWYMHKPESVLDNATHNIFWAFEMETDHLISAKRPDLVIANKRENLPNSGLCRTSRPQSENQRKWKERQVHVWRYSCPRQTRGWFRFHCADRSASWIYLRMTRSLHYLPAFCFFFFFLDSDGQINH